LNAALGVAQLAKLEKFLKAKRQLLAKYKKSFAGFAGGKIMDEPANSKSNFWLQALILDGGNKNQILEVANAQKIFCRPLWKPIHQLPHFKDAPCMDLSKAEEMYGRIINLPSSPNLV